MSSTYRVAKAHAYGNDFLFVTHADAAVEDAGALARRLCARHSGVGGDGLILYTLTGEGARMTLFNADGSPSELSGNGLRCLAALNQRLRDGEAAVQGEERQTTWNFVTGAGDKSLELIAQHGERYTFRAAMGHPADVQQEALTVDGEPLQVTTLSMGNPQCVVVLPALPDDERFACLGPALSQHPRFPAGTNVEFAVVAAAERLHIRIWERGVGPTHASGTGACAAAVAAMHAGLVDRDVEVVSPGGAQRVQWDERGVVLTGWAELVFLAAHVTREV